jgi:hypothetical protein
MLIFSTGFGLLNNNLWAANDLSADTDMMPLITEPIDPLSDSLVTPQSKQQADAPSHVLAPEVTKPELQNPEPNLSEAIPEKSDESTSDASTKLSDKTAEPESTPSTEQALESPTQSVEAYERARQDLIYQNSIPSFSTQFNFFPRAFSQADLRLPTQTSDYAQEKPKLRGFSLSLEKSFVGSFGGLHLGLQGALYGSTDRGGFSSLMPALYSISPIIKYEAVYLRRQWFVPYFGFDFEVLRYSYTYQNKKIRNLETLPRINIGMMFFLNVLESSASGELFSNFGIKRTYLTAEYSMTHQSNVTQLVLTEKALRVGLRFEY